MTSDKLTIKAIASPGRDDLTITDYEWKVNGVIQKDNSNELIIKKSSLNIGTNTISLKVKNSCGKWSQEYLKSINYPGENMEKTIELVVDKPTVESTVVVDLLATVTLSIKDSLNRPITSAQVTLDETVKTTDTNGTVVFSDVKYGTKSVHIVI